MARLTKDTCTLCRRERRKLFLKGEKCNSQKCPVSKRVYPPGQHGLSRGKKISDYGLALREKQKVKRIYGILERQFRNYFEKAEKKQGVTGEILLEMIEMRLDTIVYRLGLANSIKQARQLVNHGHFLVNNKKVDIPSYQLEPGDKIEVKEGSKKNKFFNSFQNQKKETVDWVKTDFRNLKGEVLRKPERRELDPDIKEQLIVELYSK